MFLSDEVSKLTSWFLNQKSDYPWRSNPSPYRVWISEVMLQQTQVQRVIEYFERWMEVLPSVEAVAAAEEDLLIKLWEGLGYYSRVRNIHKAAKVLEEQYDGILPDTYEQLSDIPGLGPYTASAILCFGYQKRALPIDANVERVLARYHGFTERVDTVEGKKHIRALAELWIPSQGPHIVAEGIIEFGQKVCGKVPDCTTCFLRKTCLGKAKAKELPLKKPPKTRIHLHREVLLLVCGDKVWMFKEEQKIMQGLLQFPYAESIEDLKNQCKAALLFQGKLQEVRHSFTHHTVDLYPSLFFVDEPFELPYGAWYGRSALIEGAFSSGHRTIARELYHALSHHRDALCLVR